MIDAIDSIERIITNPSCFKREARIQRTPETKHLIYDTKEVAESIKLKNDLRKAINDELEQVRIVADQAEQYIDTYWGDATKESEIQRCTKIIEREDNLHDEYQSVECQINTLYFRIKRTIRRTGEQLRIRVAYEVPQSEKNEPDTASMLYKFDHQRPRESEEMEEENTGENLNSKLRSSAQAKGKTQRDEKWINLLQV